MELDQNQIGVIKMHVGSYEKMQKFVKDYLLNQKTLSVLELGSCDINGTYKPLFIKENWYYTGADLNSGPNVDIVLKNAYSWNEIPDNSYNVVISGSVLEHIEFPWLTMCEIKRVLKVNGLTCNIAPSSGFEHRYPVDCYRYYPDGFHALIKWAKLIPIEIYTDWNTNSSPDGGHVWKDTVMIATKYE
jgi:hypothetical protein